MPTLKYIFSNLAREVAGLHSSGPTRAGHPRLGSWVRLAKETLGNTLSAMSLVTSLGSGITGRWIHGTTKTMGPLMGIWYPGQMVGPSWRELLSSLQSLAEYINFFFIPFHLVSYDSDGLHWVWLNYYSNKAHEYEGTKMGNDLNNAYK